MNFHFNFRKLTQLFNLCRELIVHENDIRKIILPVKPQTVDSLLEQLGLQYKFSLQFEDPDFNNSLVNLTDIADLPDKPTLKIVSLRTTPTSSTADTEIIQVIIKRTAWPETFEIPTFPVDVEYRLHQANRLGLLDCNPVP